MFVNAFLHAGKPLIRNRSVYACDERIVLQLLNRKLGYLM